jgi:hypothetical protein
MTPDVAVVIPLNNPVGPADDTVVEIETLLQLNLWNLGLVWFIVTFHT